jgi:uncharacterized protein (DUF2225 family)
MMEKAGASGEVLKGASVIAEDIQSTIETIFDHEPGQAGYELAGLIYQLLDQRSKENVRKQLSWIRMSLFSIIDQKWDSVEKSTFLLAYSLRWKRGYEKLQQGVLSKFEELEEEIQQASPKSTTKLD